MIPSLHCASSQIYDDSQGRWQQLREGLASQNVTAFAFTSDPPWLEQIEVWLKSGGTLFDLNAWPLGGSDVTHSQGPVKGISPPLRSGY